MKVKSRQCPNDPGAMKHLYIKTSTNFHQKWTTVKWQYCLLCGLILTD